MKNLRQLVARVGAGAVGLGGPLAFLTLFFAWPAATLIAKGFVAPSGGLDLSGLSEVLSAPRTWRVIARTLWMALLGTCVSLLVGLPGAYALYCCRFPGQRALRALISVPFVLPTVVVGVAFRSLLAPQGWLGFLNLDGTPAAVIAAMVFFNYSLVVRNVGSFWAQIDGRRAQVAACLGARPLRVFTSVTFPTLLPAIASAASLVFLYCATSFGIVLILGGSKLTTVESEIYMLTTQYLDLRSASVLSIVQLVVIAVSLIVAEAARRRGTRAVTLRSSQLGHRVRRGDVWTLVMSAGVVLVLVVLPLAALVWRSLHQRGRFTFEHYLKLADSSFTPALRVSPLQALGHSLLVALVAMVIALSVGVCVVLLVTRHPRSRAGRVALSLLESAFMLPLGVSAVTVGFGFLITMNRPPLDLRSSWILVPCAQAVVALPLVVRLIAPSLRAINPRLREAAASLGASEARILATIDGPVLLRSLGIAAGFAIATSLGEFGATSFLAKGDSVTLPVVIYRLISRPDALDQGVAMASCVLLALVCALLITCMEWLRPAEIGETV